MVRSQGLMERVKSIVMRQKREDALSSLEQNLLERRREYHALKQAVAGLLYLRNKCEADLFEERAAAARLNDLARQALLEGDEGRALWCVAEQNRILQRLPQAEEELREIRLDTGEAKRTLAVVRDQVEALERERSSARATLANARARRRVEELLTRLAAPESRALERARGEIARVKSERLLDRELGILPESELPALEGRDRADLEALRRRLRGPAR